MGSIMRIKGTTRRLTEMVTTDIAEAIERAKSELGFSKDEESTLHLRINEKHSLAVFPLAGLTGSLLHLRINEKHSLAVFCCGSEMDIQVCIAT